MIAPAKSFIIGEYGVLDRGSALVITHPPYFELITTPAKKLNLGNIHPDSPAGKLLLATQPKIHCEFIDPYNNLGGVGASSAQFHCVYNNLKPPEDLFSSYKIYAGEKPSGADILAQTRVGLSWVTPHIQSVTPIAWPFPDIQLLLFKTPTKLATHTHLDTLPKQDYSALITQSHSAYNAIKHKNPEQFIQALKQFSQEQDKLGLLAPQAIDFKDSLCTRGCGAMGADVLAVFCHPNKINFIKQKSHQYNLIFIAQPLEYST